MKRFLKWRPEWVYSVSIAFLFGSGVLRSLLSYYTLPNVLVPTLLVLAVWLTLFLLEPATSRRWPRFFILYLIIQTALTLVLMFNPQPADFYALQYAILSMQIAKHYSTRLGTVLIACFTPLTFIPLLLTSGFAMAAALALVYMAANALTASYALAARHAEKLGAQNQATLLELQEANRQLQAYSEQMQQLTVARERGRLARELHDSVTQSIFSMTLTTQSALLLLERDPGRVGEQLARMGELAQGALEEMQTLISELNPENLTEGGLANALRRHLAARHLPESLSVALDAKGEQELAPSEEQGLFRIAQEALNNIVKHAGASQASIRLHLSEPFSMEIEDNGQGFDLRQANQGRGVGLSSMRERAAEIGWDLQVSSTPGAGTRIHLERASLKGQDKSVDNTPESPIPNPQLPDTQLPDLQSPPPQKEGR